MDVIHNGIKNDFKTEYDLKRMLLKLKCIIRVNSYSNNYSREEINFYYESLNGKVECVVVKKNNLFAGYIEHNNIAYELDSYDVKQLHGKVVAFIIENKFK